MPIGKRAGTAGWIKDFERVYGGDEVFHFGIGELVRFVVVGQQMSEFGFYIAATETQRSVPATFFEMGDEGFVYHVVDDFAWGVEGTCLFASSCAGFGVICRKQVFRRLVRGVSGSKATSCSIGVFLGNREFVAVEDMD